MEENKKIEKEEIKAASGGGDRQPDIFGNDGNDVVFPVNIKICPTCMSQDLTRTNDSFPYEYVCNACGNVFKLPC